MKTVVLLSGGIDSSVLLRRLAAEGRELEPLFVDYGQRARWQELEAARWQCHALRLDTPLAGHSKIEVIRLGAGLGVDFAHTYSCLLGHPRQCGRCPQCRKRRAAFTAAGLTEPNGLYQSGS